MTLQCDRALGGHAGQLRVVNHALAIQVNRESITHHADHHAIPLPNRLVSAHLRRACRAHRRRHRWIRAVAPHLARAARPTPDIHLALAVSAQVDTTVALLNLHLFHIPCRIALLGAVGSKHRPLDLPLMLLGPAPIGN